MHLFMLSNKTALQWGSTKGKIIAGRLIRVFTEGFNGMERKGAKRTTLSVFLSAPGRIMPGNLPTMKEVSPPSFFPRKENKHIRLPPVNYEKVVHHSHSGMRIPIVIPDIHIFIIVFILSQSSHPYPNHEFCFFKDLYFIFPTNIRHI